MNKILFVCTGNYYRSRFAEIYFNVQSEKRNLDWNAFSKGFDISNNSNIGLISNHVICELQELKISLPNDLTFPKILTENDLMQAKKIIAMNLSEHKPFVLKQFPTW
ncbi:MAG: low molecular weight phosphatase family protein, partial [Bacteroidetes bacterium]|nr:low molecular weight phosphatase family protein [Bacteroidota bacterium]